MAPTVSKQLPATHHQELLLLSSWALVLTHQPSCGNSTISLFFVMLAILHHLAICQRRPIDTTRILMHFNNPSPHKRQAVFVSAPGSLYKVIKTSNLMCSSRFGATAIWGLIWMTSLFYCHSSNICVMQWQTLNISIGWAEEYLDSGYPEFRTSANTHTHTI